MTFGGHAPSEPRLFPGQAEVTALPLAAPQLSVVAPVFNEELCVRPFLEELSAALSLARIRHRDHLRERRVDRWHA